MATARKLLVDPEQPLYYHITSRCVQRAWLLGKDPVTGQNYNHRKDWLLYLLETITPAFSVSVQTYALMSNHFHMVVYYDPTANRTWSDEEVAHRWYTAHPAQLPRPSTEQTRAEAVELLASDETAIAHCRKQLGSLSEYMKCLKQSIALKANAELNTDGHFWSARFYSGAILSDDALLTTMAYVDLNPVRAKIAQHLEDCQHTGVLQHIQAAEVSESKLAEYLAPCFDGLKRPSDWVRISLAAYKNFLTTLIELTKRRTTRLPPPGTPNRAMTKDERWALARQTLRRRPRAIGTAAEIKTWLEYRGLASRELPLPEFTR